MKKVWKVVSLLFAAGIVLGLTGCDSGLNQKDDPDSKKHEHTFEEKWTNDASYHWHECTDENCTEISGKEMHKFGESKVTKEATTETEGSKEQECTVCKYKVVTTIPKIHKHSYTDEWTKDEISHWHKCTKTDCDEIKDKDYHSFGDWVITVNATITEEGSKQKECTVCGYKKIVNIPKIHVHTYPSEWTTDETSHWHECTQTGCDEIEDKGDHSFGSWIITKHSTQTEEGSKYKECTVCGYKVTEEIPISTHNHSFTIQIDTKEATVFVPGYTEKKCELCDETKRVYTQRLLCEEPFDFETEQKTTTAKAKIYFGDFPRTIAAQSEDGTKIYGKDKLTEITISETDTVKRGMFKYYKGSDGEYYVKEMEYPNNNVNVKYSDGSNPKFAINNSYRYFRVEPIVWILVTDSYEKTGKPLYVAEEIVNGNIEFYKPVKGNNVRFVNNEKGQLTYMYNNVYEISRIRAYLNGKMFYENDGYFNDANDFKNYSINATYNELGFLQTAFTNTAKEKIYCDEVHIRNDVASANSSVSTDTQYDENAFKGYNGTYLSCDLNDPIFLLSYEEVTNPAYGYPASANNDENNPRKHKYTDYARATGCYPGDDGCSNWWLRSPSTHDEINGSKVKYVVLNGEVYNALVSEPSNITAQGIGIGVLPAMVMDF